MNELRVLHGGRRRRRQPTDWAELGVLSVLVALMFAVYTGCVLAGYYLMQVI